MSLEIIINSLPLKLGEAVNPASLVEADFHKAGPIRRLLTNLPLGQTVFQTDNCKLECFDDEFSIYPCIHGYLTRDRQWKTKATVFVEDGKVWKFEFQVVDGHYAASNFLDRFQKACSAVLGDPVESSRLHTRWQNGSSAVTSIMHPDLVNVDFLMELTDSREASPRI